MWRASVSGMGSDELARSKSISASPRYADEKRKKKRRLRRIERVSSLTELFFIRSRWSSCARGERGYEHSSRLEQAHRAPSACGQRLPETWTCLQRALR